MNDSSTTNVWIWFLEASGLKGRYIKNFYYKGAHDSSYFEFFLKKEHAEYFMNLERFNLIDLSDPHFQEGLSRALYRFFNLFRFLTCAFLWFQISIALEAAITWVPTRNKVHRISCSNYQENYKPNILQSWSFLLFTWVRGKRAKLVL